MSQSNLRNPKTEQMWDIQSSKMACTFEFQEKILIYDICIPRLPKIIITFLYTVNLISWTLPDFPIYHINTSNLKSQLLPLPPIFLGVFCASQISSCVVWRFFKHMGSFRVGHLKSAEVLMPCKKLWIFWVASRAMGCYIIPWDFDRRGGRKLPIFCWGGWVGLNFRSFLI